MWRRTGQFILNNRLPLLIVLSAITAVMGYWASKVELSYEFSKAIPTDNLKYKTYQEFRKKFGEDGNLLVIGLQKDNLFQETFFNDYAQLQKDIKKVKGVEEFRVEMLVKWR